MSPRGKHVPESPASFYASLGRHIAGGVAVVAVVALVISLATRDDDGSAVGVGTNSPTPTATETLEPSASPSATEVPSTPSTPERTPRPREEITITVLNGEGTSGLASSTSDKLVAAGYTVNNVDDAEPRNKTVIYFQPGAKPEALLLLEDFPELLRAKPAKGDEVDDGSLLTVILGADYEA